MRHGAEREIALDGADKFAREQRSQLVIAVAIEKLAQILVAFAQGVESFEQAFDGIGNRGGGATETDRARDGSELSHAAAREQYLLAAKRTMSLPERRYLEGKAALPGAERHLG